MTVIPFPEQATPPPVAGAGAGATTRVTGSYCSPTGRVGSFTGCYRLERLLSQWGQPAAAGVFTGELTDADGTLVGRGSRRHTAAVDFHATASTPVVRLGPVDVNLLGFLVTMAEFEIGVSDGALRGASAEA